MLGALTELPLDAATKIGDQLAEKDWKQLCMMLFVLCTIGAITVIVYLVRKNEHYSNRLHAAFNACTSAQMQLATKLGENSSIIVETREILRCATEQNERTEKALDGIEAQLRRRPSHG